MLFDQSVHLELIAALCDGAKHYSNRVGTTHACALYQYHLSMLVLRESNRASAIERMLYYYRHISIFVFFPVQYCVFLVTAMHA